MLLSIGMIVKNEEKYLEQCLTALKPILDNVDSELIIADTGSTDNTVEIAKKFTDNVFYFEWINDFAAARNSTLDKAKGEWYMFIDADEVIRDCTPLIDFFNSGEYKKYKSATYVQRSYNDLKKMDLYTDYRPHRLTALLNGIRFESPIHENFDQYFKPIKNLDVIADHYGYVYMDNGKIIDGATEKKTTRNLELLFQKLEDGTAGGATYGHIADCYFWLKDYDNAIKYIDIGLENCEPNSYTKISYISKKLKFLMANNNDFNEIIELCKYYFSKDNLARTEKLVSDSYVYFIWAVVSFSLKDYTETINKSVLGFDIYRGYLNGKLITPELNYCTVDTTIPILKMVCNIFLAACINQGKCDIATREIDIIPIEKFTSDAEFMEKYLNMRTEVMENTNYNKLPDLYFRLDKLNRERFATILIRNVFKTEKIEHFLKKLSLIMGDDERLDDIIKICKTHFGGHRLPYSQIVDFIEKHGTKDNEIVWILMMIKNFDVTPFICADDFNAEKSIIAVFGDFPNNSLAMDVFKNSINNLSADGVDIMTASFVKVLYSATEKGFNTTSMIVYLGDLGRRWKELNPETEVPESVDFALTIGEIAELHRKKHYDESIARLTELVGEGEPSSDSNNTKVLRHYLSLVQEDNKMAEEMQQNHNANPMMIQLAEQIKQEIRIMIDQWDLNGAEDALNQMAKMAPFDPDIENFRDEINDRKVNYMKYM